MTRTHYQTVTLSEVVRRAEQILVVRHAEPSFRIAEEKIGVRLSADAPPFAYRVQRYVVDSVVLGSEELAGEPIEVEPANLEAKRRNYADYYGRGLSKHGIEERYSPQSVESATTYLIFLTTSGDHYRFCVNGAVEGLMFLDEVRTLADGG